MGGGVSWTLGVGVSGNKILYIESIKYILLYHFIRENIYVLEKSRRICVQMVSVDKIDTIKDPFREAKEGPRLEWVSYK